jgi:hypothetical protein
VRRDGDAEGGDNVKRWAARILVFVVLGAIVNIAVAWVLVATYGVGNYEGGDATNELWRSYAPQEFQPTPSRGERAACRGLEYFHFYAWPRDEGRSSYEGAFFCLAGFPFLSMLGHSYQQSQTIDGPLLVRTNTFVAIRLRETEQEPTRLPLLPLWPGFAINTVFYAMILWGLFAAPFALRRRMRIKRGLCPKCAYDLRGSGGACPECGATK